MTFGIGLFSLPFYTGKMGLGLGMGMIVLAGILNFFTFRLIFQVSSVTKKSTFLENVKKVLPGSLYQFSRFTVGLSLFSMFVFYMIAAYNILEFLLYYLNVLDDNDMSDPDKM